MKKGSLLISLICLNYCLFAQQNSTDSSQQFLFIVRYKSNMKTTDTDKLKSNARHWGVYIKELAQSGKLISGFRPGTDGRTISGLNKVSTNTAYIKDGEEIGSIFLIKAANMEEAKSIARRCPVYEFDGNVEIRPVINTAN